MPILMNLQILCICAESCMGLARQAALLASSSFIVKFATRTEIPILGPRSKAGSYQQPPIVSCPNKTFIIWRLFSRQKK